MDPETPPDTPPQHAELFTPSHGHGKLRRGGTNRGGPGRPPEEWRRELRSRCSPERIDELYEAAVAKGDLRVQLSLLIFLAEYGFGKPTQEVDVNFGKNVFIHYPEKLPAGFGAVENPLEIKNI